jgi:DNA repair protein RadA/Sms
MAKPDKTLFECTECGAQSPKWLGRCAECSAWSTLVEVAARRATALRGARSSAGALGARTPVALESVRGERTERIATSFGELDRVLGGGLVPGAAVLIGGDPGIGKSTLLLQALLGMARAGLRVLYASGEESASQIVLRAERLASGEMGGVSLLCTTELGDVVAALEAERFAVVVIDSIQTLRAAELDSAPGSVAQLREVSSRLIERAKTDGNALLLIGHVTKDGGLAGPKVLEHLVDVVLSFEGEPAHSYRMLRGQKNRFGATSEVGVFDMAAEGLREVSDPSALFLHERAERAPGSAVFPAAAGSRPMLIEVQALLAPAQYGAPRRVATGLDSNRLALMLAVLHRKANVHLLDLDVFAAIAGGMRVDEPAMDLALCAAVVSALRERPIAEGTLAFGEVGLTGEVRGVGRVAGRIAEAKRHGFRRVVLPAACVQGLTSADTKKIELVGVKRLEDALASLF